MRRLALLALAASLGLPGGAARAEVFQRAPADVLDLLTLVQADARPGSERIQVVNGVVVRTTVTTSRLAPDALLDRVEAAFAPGAAAGSAPGAAPPSEEAVVAGARRALARSLQLPFRVSGEGFGAFGRLAGGGPQDTERLADALGDARRVGPAGAGGFVVVALDEGDRTRVVTTRFDADFDPAALVGADPGDVGGGDVPGLARVPGTRRALTFSEYSEAPDAHMVGYVGHAPVDTHVRHWESQLRHLGLDPHRVPLSEPGRALVVAVDATREVAIYVSRSQDPAPGGPPRTLDLIQVRTNGARPGPEER